MAATLQHPAQYDQPFNPGELKALPVFPDVKSMDTPTTTAEMLQVINSLKNIKSPGTNGIPGEVFIERMNGTSS